MTKPRVVLVDDNAAFLELFGSLPEVRDYELRTFSGARPALDELSREPADLIITDVQMPGIDGFAFFHQVQDQAPHIPVILITAFGSTEQAVQAVQQGAFHYFEKPITDKLPLFWATVREALVKGRMLQQLDLYRKKRDLLDKTVTPLIGVSESIQEVIASIQQVAELPATVLISGETGTGKDLAARLIHEHSGRAPEAFFPVSCSEFAPGILESELFGHEKGAFTGAVALRKGLFEVADQGTLFLDEINDAPASLQAKLLRVLESKQYTRVGSSVALRSDFRVLAATNQDLEKSVAAGTFRNDLYYRIKVYEIKMPALRHRKEDIPLLAEFYLKKFNQAYTRAIEGFSEDALHALRAYNWPGNVRELVNIIERAAIICKGAAITTAHLPFDPEPVRCISDLNLADMERFYIELAIKRTAGNKTRAAGLLGISRKTLIEKLKHYRRVNIAGDINSK